MPTAMARCRRALAGAGAERSAGDAVQHKQAFGTIVPDVHLHDLAIAHHEAIDVPVALERGTVGPFAVKGAQIVDDGLARARDDVAPFHLLFHPFVATSV